MKCSLGGQCFHSGDKSFVDRYIFIWKCFMSVVSCLFLGLMDGWLWFSLQVFGWRCLTPLRLSPCLPIISATHTVRRWQKSWAQIFFRSKCSSASIQSGSLIPKWFLEDWRADHLCGGEASTARPPECMLPLTALQVVWIYVLLFYPNMGKASICFHIKNNVRGQGLDGRFCFAPFG